MWVFCYPFFFVILYLVFCSFWGIEPALSFALLFIVVCLFLLFVFLLFSLHGFSVLFFFTFMDFRGGGV